MKIYTEICDLDDFTAWLEAVETKEALVAGGYGEEFMERLEECYPDGITETELNDLLWFEKEFCYKLVGLNSHGVEPADASEVALYLDDDIDAFIDEYNKEHDTNFTSEELGISGYGFESSIEEWLEENQEDDTDEEYLSDKWINDGGYDEIMEAIVEAVENLSEE